MASKVLLRELSLLPSARVMVRLPLIRERARIGSAKRNRVRCALCDDKGFRYVRSNQYPTGAMRQCSHNPKVETRYESADPNRPKTAPSPNAQNSPLRGETSPNEK